MSERAAAMMEEWITVSSRVYLSAPLDHLSEMALFPLLLFMNRELARGTTILLNVYDVT